MARTKEIATREDRMVAAVAARPSYLPAITDESDIHQIKQRAPAMPILSLESDQFQLVEGQTLIKTFDTDELEMYFLFIFLEPQRRAYEGPWDPKNPQEPICISNNSISPEDDSPDPQSDSCATCWRSDKDTSRHDKCSWLRNAVVMIEYENEAGDTVNCVARLRLNGNTLFGEENRSAGELNAETMIATYRDTLQAELYYHPVLAFFDTDTKGAQSKLLFEILIDKHPSEDTYALIMEQKKLHDYDTLTRLTVYKDGESDDGGDESEPPAQRETKAEGKTRQTKKTASKASNTRSKRSSAKAETGDDSAGTDPAPRSRRTRKKATQSRGDTGAQPDDGGEAESASSGRDDQESRDVDPLENPDVMAAIGNVELP